MKSRNGILYLKVSAMVITESVFIALLIWSTLTIWKVW